MFTSDGVYVTSATKTLSFCYGHRLLNYNGKCSKLHGHNALVDVTYQVGTIGRDGFAIDFTELKNGIGKWIDDNLDHKTLLEETDPIASALTTIDEEFVIVPFRPTAENIAVWIYHQAIKIHGPNVVSIKMYETPSSFVIIGV